MSSPVLSIVIVEYKSIDEANACVEALCQKISIPFEVIVSSNSMYTEAQQGSITNARQNVRWLFNARNGGFAYAMNRGLEVARGNYLVIMNSDCTLLDDLQPLVSFLEQHDEVGAIAPQLRAADGEIQDTARPYVTPYSFLKRLFNRFRKKTVCVMEEGMDYSKVQTVDWVIGAFIMATRKAYEATNGLDEEFFMYAEDVDWCTRIRQQGFEIVYYPKVAVEYKGTRRARSSWKYKKIFLKSHLHYWNKFGFIGGSYPKRKNIAL